MKNSYSIIGRLGKDPEVRHLEGGKCVAKFTVATSEFRKDANGERKEHTDWHDVEVWNKTAEFCENYLKKGDLVSVEGKHKTDSWEDKETGKTVYRSKLSAFSVLSLNNKREDTASATPAIENYAPTATPAPQAEDDLPF